MNLVSLKFNRRELKLFSRDESDQSVINEIFKFKEYRSAEKIIQEAREPILDIGAHAGFFSLYCRVLNSDVAIYALEPERGNLTICQKNIQTNNFSNITVVAGALAAISGQRKLLISSDSINHRLVLADEETMGGQTEEVTVYSLADFCQKFKLKKISLIKIDIEGGEYEVVSNFKKQDWSKIGALVLEYHNQGDSGRELLEQTLRVNGFSVQNFPSHFDKQLGFLLAVNKR